jgi:Outer membrane cobalamin receptor protein
MARSHLTYGTLAFAALLVASPFSAWAQDPSPAPDPVRIAEWPQSRVIAMGRALFRQDRASWVATDALMAHLNGAAPPEGFAGWIVVGEGSDQLVRFVRRVDDQVRAVFDVPVHEGVAGELRVVDEPLTDEQMPLFRARETAAANIGRLRCSRQLNVVTLPDPDSDNLLVWLLTSTTDANIIPFGGHYRFTISPDGSRVISRDMLSNSCLNLPRPPTSGPQGAPAGLVVSQIVSDGPVETHVFLSLQNRLSIYVSAGGRLYAVQGDRIRRVQQ